LNNCATQRSNAVAFFTNYMSVHPTLIKVLHYHFGNIGASDFSFYYIGPNFEPQVHHEGS
jgi:hypothetical protein